MVSPVAEEHGNVACWPVEKFGLFFSGNYMGVVLQLRMYAFRAEYFHY